MLRQRAEVPESWKLGQVAYAARGEHTDRVDSALIHVQEPATRAQARIEGRFKLARGEPVSLAIPLLSVPSTPNQSPAGSSGNAIVDLLRGSVLSPECLRLAHFVAASLFASRGSEVQSTRRDSEADGAVTA